MANLNHADCQHSIIDLIKNPVNALSDTIFVIAGEHLRLWRAGIIGQQFDSSHDSLHIFFRDALQILLDRLFENDVIARHWISVL